MAETSRNVLVLPTDQGRVEQLRRKLAEYREIIETSKTRRFDKYVDASCKAAILEQLLRNGQVAVCALRDELSRTEVDFFNPIAFENACAVAKTWCEIRGKINF